MLLGSAPLASGRGKAAMRLFAISDLHVDFAANARWVESLSKEEFSGDALLVAGDVAHQVEGIRSALSALRARFARVFYVPGNHDLWVRGAGTSLDKWMLLQAMCREIGIDTGPDWAGGAWVVPLFSWYDDSLDGRTSSAALANWADFRHCRWPFPLDSVATHFAAANRDRLAPPRALVVSFSHFLPRADLLPPASLLRFRGLPAVAGSRQLEVQIRALGASIHVFGHSHINRDLVLQGVRYVQQSLGYPRERNGRECCLKQVL